MVLNVALMVSWIVLLAGQKSWTWLTIGTVVFARMLIVLTFYQVLTIKEVRLNQRQANFVDSVTHELKSPIASLKLYLETLQLRTVDEKQRIHFYEVMENELDRLDRLISQLLEVGTLDAIGHASEPEDIELEPLLRRCAESASVHHKCTDTEVFSFDIDPAVIRARRMVLEMIFGNLLDNAIKYSSSPPNVEVQVRVKDRGRVVTRICDNGNGIPADMRSKVFRIFYRGGNELERTQKGTGLGLYIVRTLVHILKGTVKVQSRVNQPGSVFEVELPGRAET